MRRQTRAAAGVRAAALTAGVLFAAACSDGLASGNGRPDASSFDAGSGGSVDAALLDGGAATKPRLYLALATASSPEGSSTDLVLVDLAAGKAAADVSMNGVSAIAARDGALLVARAFGYTRICELDRDTLAVTRTQTLPWDPAPALFTADGLYMYAGHGEGVVSRVRVADGQVLGEVTVPAVPGSAAPGAITGLGLSPAGSTLAVTTSYGGSDNSVALIAVEADSLVLVGQWEPPMFSTSNCTRQAAGPIFGRSGSYFATFDANCGAFDVYDADTGSPSVTGSVLLARPMGVYVAQTTVADALGQFWAPTDSSIYRTSETDMSRQAMFPFGSSSAPETGLLVIDSNGRTIYAVPVDPRTNGILTVDVTTGAQTAQAWDLDLVPLGALPLALEYADH
jgi:DNA-binding beta-propeller fold protein YncE